MLYYSQSRFNTPTEVIYCGFQACCLRLSLGCFNYDFIVQDLGKRIFLVSCFRDQLNLIPFKGLYDLFRVMFFRLAPSFSSRVKLGTHSHYSIL